MPYTHLKNTIIVFLPYAGKLHGNGKIIKERSY
jgi:hypothetical protein